MESIARRLSVLANASGSQDLVLDAYPADVMIRWKRIAARAMSNAVTRVDILVKRHASEFVFSARAQAAAGRTVGASPDVILPGDYQIMARFVGATSGDTLELCAFGERVE